MGFEQVRIAYCVARDEIAGKHYKIGVVFYDFVSDFIENYTGRSGTDVDPLADDTGDYEHFYGYIHNTNVTAGDVPYKADSFILISAGEDGIYGNEDDVANFYPEFPVDPLPGLP